MSMPNLGVFSSCTYQAETCPVGIQPSYHYPHNPIFPIDKRHRLVMHRIIETNSWRPEMHPADDGGCLQFSGGREDDGSRNSMVRKVTDVLHAVACFITNLSVG